MHKQSIMKKGVYQFFVYFTLALGLLGLGFFIFEVAQSGGFNSYAILCLVLMILGMVGFVLNQVLYRQFKKRDPSLYEQVECPHCHTMNSKKDLFCRKCGKSLH